MDEVDQWMTSPRSGVFIRTIPVDESGLHAQMNEHGMKRGGLQRHPPDIHQVLCLSLSVSPTLKSYVFGSVQFCKITGQEFFAESD